MKKTLAFMVALFSLAGVVLLLSGCAALEKQPAEIGTSGPPHQLIFYEKEELSAFPVETDVTMYARRCPFEETVLELYAPLWMGCCYSITYLFAGSLPDQYGV